MALLDLPEDPALWQILGTPQPDRLACAHGHARLLVERSGDEIEVSFLAEEIHLSTRGAEHRFERLPLHDGPIPDGAPADLLAAGAWIAARAAGAPARRLVAAIEALAPAWSLRLRRHARITFHELPGGGIQIRILPLGLVAGPSDGLDAPAPAPLAQALRLLALLPAPEAASADHGDLLFHPVIAGAPESGHARLAARTEAARLLAETGLPWPPGILP